MGRISGRVKAGVNEACLGRVSSSRMVQVTSEASFDLQPLGFPWRTRDPFLFCVHHLDHYPNGNGRMGPDASLAGRQIGMDFEGKDGWRMYHGQAVPGFPAHPHRGFETVTLARCGFIDHSDSLGAAARFGEGDVQWMTAGRGIVHSEMFPLLAADRPNPLELFQIWLNLPARDKMAEPSFALMWSDEIPRHRVEDAEGRVTEVVTVAGAYGAEPPAPPPRSWAADPASEVAIWTLAMAPGARFELPAAKDARVNRNLYFFEGQQVSVGGRVLREHTAIAFRSPDRAVLENGPEPSQLLLLQGRPIGEPVVQHGPFVMNTSEEIYRAMHDYQRTRFGGWPWPSNEPVHPADAGRFVLAG